MENKQRQTELLDYLKSKHFASIAELASILYTSEATVRRDVAKLESKGAVKSVYGGVVIAEYEKTPVPIYLRDRENSKNKELIAKKAAELISDNDTVILDSSSTVRRICKYIKKKKGLTIITNNLRVLNELRDTDIKVVCTGGNFVGKRDCFVGHFAEEFIRNIKADILFFSSQGVNDLGEITDSSEDEIAIRRAMLNSAEKTVFLADRSKLGNDYSFVLCRTSDVDYNIVM